jgi:hypothetical protein
MPIGTRRSCVMKKKPEVNNLMTLSFKVRDTCWFTFKRLVRPTLINANMQALPGHRDQLLTSLVYGSNLPPYFITHWHTELEIIFFHNKKLALVPWRSPSSRHDSLVSRLSHPRWRCPRPGAGVGPEYRGTPAPPLHVSIFSLPHTSSTYTVYDRKPEQLWERLAIVSPKFKRS